VKQRSSCLHCSTKHKNFTPFYFIFFFNIITDEFKTNRSLVDKIARIIMKMATGKEFQIYRDWKVEGDRQLGMFQVVLCRPYGHTRAVVLERR